MGLSVLLIAEGDRGSDVDDGMSPLEDFAVVTRAKRAGHIELQLARINIGLVLGHGKHAGLLGIGSKSASDDPSVLEKDEGDMRSELSSASQRGIHVDETGRLTKLVIPVTTAIFDILGRQVGDRERGRLVSVGSV